MNNENEKLSPNREKRIERKIKMDDIIKLLLNKIKTEKKKKNFDKVKSLESELVKIKHSNKPDKLQNAQKELNKTQVVDKNLHEIKMKYI